MSNIFIGNHPSSVRLHQLIEDIGRLHDEKQADYGTANDPFHNLRNAKDFGVSPFVGCMIRANDKMKRIQAFAQKGELANESVFDSLKDMAVYSLIGIVLLEEELAAKRVSGTNGEN